MEEQKPQPEDKSLELRKYQEDLAEKYGLPSPFQTGLLKQMAADMVESGLLPDCFRGKPMAAYLAMARGRELDISPIESVMETFWPSPGGKLGMFSNKCLDILHRRGVKSKFVKEEADGCEILFIPPNDHEPYNAKFDISEAVTAGLMKDGSSWKKWPKDMCRSRAIGRGWKAMAGVAGKGVNLMTPEEIQEIEFETVSPASNGQPEVQAEPARAGRKPKDKPIDVKAETVSDPVNGNPAPSTETVETDAKPTVTNATDASHSPVKETQAFYVVPSDAQLPTLDKIEPGPIEKLNIAVLKTLDLPEAMKTSDTATKATGTVHYVLTFKPEDGKASVIHTSKLPEKEKPAPKPKPEPLQKMYIVVSEAVCKSATETAEITAAATNPAHPILSTCELIAQANANNTGKTYLVVYLNEHKQYELASKAEPPSSAHTPQPTQSGPNPEELAERTYINEKFKECVALVPQTVARPKRRGIVESYLCAYLGIDEIKGLSKDLIRSRQAVDACGKRLVENPVEFEANAIEWGKADRPVFAQVDEKAAPQMTNSEITAMAKYYLERNWTGTVTGLAEQYRRTTKPDPAEFCKMLRFYGIESLPEKDAGAYFAVALTYDKETAKAFAMRVDGKEYGNTLTKIRDQFDGAELSGISPDKFKGALAGILEGTPAEEPSLFT